MAKRKPAYEVRAQTLASLSQKLGSVFSVQASTELQVDTKAEIASFGCKSCHTKFGAFANSQPFCVTCGSDEVEPTEPDDEDEVQALASDSNLSAVTCTSCGTHNILDTQTASALEGKLHCITCGTAINYAAPDIDDLGSDPLEDEGEDNLGEEVVEGGKNCKASDDNDDDDLGGDDVTDADSDTVDVPLVDVVDVQDDEAELSTLLHDGVLVATYNGLPIATLTKEMAGVNADLYTKPTFTTALRHTASNQGIKAALRHYNFQLVVAKFPLQKLVQAGVEKALAEQSVQLTASMTALGSDFEQCLGIASVGLNKDFFKGKSNALKVGLYNELSNAGVHKPAALVQRVFAQYSQAFVATLVETAQELMGKSVEVRNQLAETLGSINTLPMDDGVEDDENIDDDGIEVTARLNGAALRPERKPVASRGTQTVSIAALRKALPGGNLF